MTENGVQWLPSLVRDMESFFDTHGGAPVRSYLKMRPTEYFDQHVWLGGSLMKRYEAEMRHEIGIDKLMWGADYPHLEGAAPVHRVTLAPRLRRHPRGRAAAHPGRQRRGPVGLRRRAQLQEVADRVGPTVADLAQPARAGRHRGHVQLEPRPAGAARHACARFLADVPVVGERTATDAFVAASEA